MEVLTSVPAPCSHVIKVRCKVFSTYRKTRVVCAAMINRGSGSLRFQGKDKFVSATFEDNPFVRSFSSVDGLHEADWKLNSVNYDTYVIDGSGDLGGISRSGEKLDNILIPGLPDESAGEFEAPITSCSWEWKPKLSVYYEKAGPENAKSFPVLFLPGFGAGSFHYENQLKDLGREYRVWAIDFLGQGLSLPVEDPTSLSKGEHIPERKESSWGFGDSAEPWASQLSFSMD